MSTVRRRAAPRRRVRVLNIFFDFVFVSRRLFDAQHVGIPKLQFWLVMDRESRILLLLLLRRREMKKKQKQRKYWVNPYLSIMNHDGENFKRKYEALKISGDDKFYEYFRMSVSSFEELLTKIAPRIQKKYVFRKPVEPMEILGLTVR
jgi:hypothetical protein